jgi:hypothetical protein
MKRTRKIAFTLIASIAIGAAASVYATGMGMGPDGGCAMAGKKMSANPGAQIDSHLAKLKNDLKITTNQEAAWALFAKTMKQQKMEMMAAMQEQMQRTPKVQPVQAAPDQIGERIAFMKQRIAGMEAAADTMKQLYGALTPKQKELLDGRIGQEQGMPM